MARCGPLCLSLAALGTLLAGAAPAAEEVAISPDEAWSAVFSDQDVQFGYTIDVPEGFEGRFGWSVSVDGRRITRGVARISGETDRPVHALVRFRSPEVREGVVVDAKLATGVFRLAGDEELASHDRILRVFPSNPFALQPVWLEGLKIRLFDPRGETATALEQVEVPFRRVYNPAALSEMSEGLLVVGEGISLEEHRSLPEVLMRLAAGGVPVIWLAPSVGRLPMPGAVSADPDLPTPSRVVLRREDAITTLDKRLDATGWPPDGKIVASTMSIVADRSRAVFEVGSRQTGWPWIEVHYSGQRATLLICGFGIVEHWAAGPTPRYLLARMLESCAPPQNGGEQ